MLIYPDAGVRGRVYGVLHNIKPRLGTPLLNFQFISNSNAFSHFYLWHY